MVNPMNVLMVIVGLAVLVMLGINAYMMMQSRRKSSEPDNADLVLHQRFDALSQIVSAQLSQNREASDRATATVSQLINEQLERTRQASDRATLTVSQQVQSFTQNMTQLQEGMKQMHESVKNVSSFQEIFKSPKLRGMWGEQSLENSLGQYFSKDMYEIQHYFKSGDAVDSVIKLPNGLLLPIDAKFNWDNFVKMTEAEDEISKDNYRKQFLSDVKTKIDEIANKYILPSENTTEYAMMYVPAEAVYYEIINNVKGVDIPAYARSRRVGIMSPNTFYLTTASILHWFKNIEFNKQTRDIMKRLERISTDGDKLAEGFRKLGTHISNAKSAFDENEKRVGLLVDRVQNVIEIGGQEEKTKELEAPIA